MIVFPAFLLQHSKDNLVITGEHRIHQITNPNTLGEKRSLFMREESESNKDIGKIGLRREG